MTTAGFGATRIHDPQDVGTLWTMRRQEHSARCALIARRASWLLRVLIDRDLLLEERCDGAAEAFAIAERWKEQMRLDGWQQVLPPTAAAPPASVNVPERRG